MSVSVETEKEGEKHGKGEGKCATFAALPVIDGIQNFCRRSLTGGCQYVNIESMEYALRKINFRRTERYVSNEIYSRVERNYYFYFY